MRVFAPFVHVSPHGLAGAAFVSIQTTDEDSCRGGLLQLTLPALRLLPQALEAAIAEYDREVQRAYSAARQQGAAV